MIDNGDVAELVGRWWWNYDQGDFDELAGMLTEDVRFTCRTDTGRTEYEEFVRADVGGRDDVMAWQTTHRRASPHPLRHMGLNVHITERTGDDQASFASYILVTHLPDGRVANLSSAIVTGSVRATPAGLRLSALHVVLDTMASVPFEAR